MPTPMVSSSIDPITFEVLKNSLISIVDEMGTLMKRAAFSSVISEGEDYACGLLDGQGRLLAQGRRDLPVFIALLEFICDSALKRIGRENLEPGDIIQTNDPYSGGTHFQDNCFLKPIFRNGEIIAFAASIGHWTDVGGPYPGSFNFNALEYYGEGLRIPPVKVYSRGRPNRDLFDLILANMRIPQERLGDIRAHISSLEIGERRLLTLVSKYGMEVASRGFEELMNYSERMLKAEIAKVPPGEYDWEDHVDMESDRIPTPKKVKLTLRADGERLIYDFTGSDPSSRSAANSSFSTTFSCVFIGTKMVLGPHIPMNHGLVRLIRVVAPEGTVVNAQPPSATSGMAATIYEKILACIFGAYSKVLPQRTVAAAHNIVNITYGGLDERVNPPAHYVSYIWTEGGYGGRSTKDGGTLIPMYGGGGRNFPIEVIESKFPVIFHRYELRQDSAGPGRWRGGLGTVREWSMLKGSAQIDVMGDREVFPPFGILGGMPGATQRLILNSGTPEERNLTLRVVGFEVAKGDRLTLLSAGGGGYGNPLERDPELVRQDVRDEYVTVEAAREHYGVVIDLGVGQADMDATARLRAEKAKG